VAAPLETPPTVCDTCADGFTQALAEIPWLVGELETTLTGRKGIDYRTVGGTPSSETRLPLHLAASGIRTELKATLTYWAKFCHETGLPHQSPHPGLPQNNHASISRWLMWRTDALTLHDRGPDAVDQITSVVAKGKRLIDRPADKWYAGPCDTETCNVELYARTKAGTLTCHECATVYDISERRSWLLQAAEDVLADATTIAVAVSWLGGIPVTPARLWKWNERGRIVPHGHDGRKPLYRVGDVLDVLASTEKVG
jgi:hypothetical protein